MKEIIIEWLVKVGLKAAMLIVALGVFLKILD